MSDDAIWAAIGAVVVANLGSILAYFYNDARWKGKIEAKVDRLSVDLDNVAELIGTKRALGRKESENGT